jgi:NADH-quinone oxidoreductase subunit F
VPSTPVSSPLRTGTIGRVLPAEPVADLRHYLEQGGGRALREAQSRPPIELIEDIEASGLRGRGGAGFPTGRKWRTVCRYQTGAIAPPTVVINGAEGEPGSFKDRALIRGDPYRVLEGALIAAYAVGADTVVVAVRRSFATEQARLAAAIDELRDDGWLGDIDLQLLAGPEEYLFGEETGLLEVLDGRAPFPRIAPPFRRGVEEVVDESVQDAAEQVIDFGTDSTSAAGVELAGPTEETIAPPTLVNNVETIANVPGIVSEGVDWFRSVGTDASPGTILCTMTGAVAHESVGEVAMGTPLLDAIESIGGGPRPGGHIRAVMSGVSNPLILGSQLRTPLSYEALDEIGGGLGCGAFIALDDRTDFASLAAGVARFLAVESCGQCTPCKQDGLALSRSFERLCRSDADEGTLEEIGSRLLTVTDSARCNLAYQYPVVLRSIVDHFGGELAGHLDGSSDPAPPDLVAPIVELEDGRATLEALHRDKQPDWTFEPVWSGESPADRLVDHRTRESD